MKNSFVIFLMVFITTLCGCSSTAKNEFIPSESQTVVYPDSDTNETINGYKEIQPEIIPTEVISEQPYESPPVDVCYYANINSKKFHYSDCRYAKTMKESSIRIEYDCDILLNEGYDPCKVCKPG